MISLRLARDKLTDVDIEPSEELCHNIASKIV